MSNLAGKVLEKQALPSHLMLDRLGKTAVPLKIFLPTTAFNGNLMPVITAKLILAPADLPAYLEHAAVLVARTQSEAGCNTFAFTRDTAHPDTLWVIEDWESDAAMLEHQASAHVKQFLAETAHFEVLESSIKKFNISSVETLA